MEESQCAANSEPKGESKRREPRDSRGSRDVANNNTMPRMLSDAYTLFDCIVAFTVVFPTRMHRHEGEQVAAKCGVV